MVLIGEGVQIQMFYPLNEFIPIIKGSFLILTKCWPDLSRRYRRQYAIQCQDIGGSYDNDKDDTLVSDI